MRRCLDCPKLIARGSRCTACQRRKDAPKNARRAQAHAVTQRLRREVGQCQICGSTYQLEVHHIIPISKGGTDDESNLVVLCHDHHQSAHHRMIASLDRRLELSFLNGDANG